MLKYLDNYYNFNILIFEFLLIYKNFIVIFVHYIIIKLLL